MSIVIFLLIVLVTAFWVYQGFFSSMVMFLDVLAAAILAFTFYEQVHAMWADSVGDGLGHGLALMAIFVVSLGILRKLTDRIIPDDVEMPKPVAMIGGGVCGFLSAMLLTGMALIAIQMMPVGSDVFSFERYSQDRETGDVYSSSLGVFGPDKFTYKLIGGLSADARFGGGNSLAYAKPDLVEQLYSSRAAPQSEARMFVPANCIKVRDWWVTNTIDHAKHELNDDGNTKGMQRSFQTKEPEKIGWQYLVATVYVDRSAAPKTGSDVRFRVPQFRVIGFDGEDKKAKKEPAVYLGCGMTDLYTHVEVGPFPVGDEQRERLVFFGPTTDFILSDAATKAVAKDNGWEFQVAFRVPTNFKPWYVAFKYGAKALVPPKPVDEAPSYASRPIGQEGGPVVSRSQRALAGISDQKLADIQAFASTLSSTGFGNQMPLPVPSNDSAVQPYVQNTRFGIPSGGHMLWQIPDDYSNLPLDVQSFMEPTGFKMVQVSFNDRRAQSMYGRAIKFAERVAAQTYLTDVDGNKHYAIGNYAIAKVGEDWFYEIQYYPNALNEVPERALSGKKPKRITPQVLENAAESERWFAFIFLVPDSIRSIEKFNTGNGDEIELLISN